MTYKTTGVYYSLNSSISFVSLKIMLAALNFSRFCVMNYKIYNTLNVSHNAKILHRNLKTEVAK